MEKIDEVMDEFVRIEHFSGCVLVAKEGKVLYSKAFGEANKDHRLPNTLDTRFSIGSVAKTFTGTGIMQLVEKGMLDVNDPVSKHLIDFPFGDNITIYHLLTHTSGLNDYSNHPRFRSFWTRIRKIDHIVPLIYGQKLKHKNPGEKFIYCSSGIVLLGAIIEQHTGQSYADYIRENILTPLDMNNTSITNLEDVVENRATGYIKSSTNVFKSNAYNLIPFIASAGIQTTVGDMLKFDQALYGTELLSEESKKVMFKPYINNFAACWRTAEVHGNFVLWHGGETAGVSAMFRRYTKDKYTLIILSNYHRTGRPVTWVLEPILFGDEYELPKQTLREFLYQNMITKGIKNTIKNVDKLLKDNGYEIKNDEDLNGFGYELLDIKRIDMAIEIFKLNTRLFPEVANTYDSLAEVYMIKGDKEAAIKSYKKALEIDPKLPSAIRMLKILSKK